MAETVETKGEKKEKNKEEETTVSTEIRKMYYARLFPTSSMIHWLSYGDADTLKNREFSFTLDGDIYVRYLSFPSKEEFRTMLIEKSPAKIDIGAVFNAPPKSHLAVNNFIPLNKEFVLDIDMTEYDDVRTCCEGAAICSKCWGLIQVAIKVLDKALRDDFGFQQLLWVYSGRRGIHCWVSDERARKMSNELRSGVIEFLTVIPRDFDFPPLHPSIMRAYKILLDYFENSFLDEQNILDDEKSTAKMLEYLPEKIRGTVQAAWKTNMTSLEKWEELKKIVTKESGRPYGTLLARIVLSYTYPRLDANVSKQLNHLLKSPFSIHPKTGRVCVPVNPATADKFDPFKVPTVHQLLEEVNTFHAASADKEEAGEKAWEQTSLASYLEYFKNFANTVTRKQQAARKKRKGAPEDW